MAATNTVLNLGKFIFFTLAVFFIGYSVYDKNKAVTATKLTVATIPATHSGTLNDSIVAYGMKFLGTPYVSAGCSVDGFDCSGFVYFVYRHFKIDVPRSSAAFEHVGTTIPIEDVQKGDLLLFLSPTRNAIGHIGIVTNPKGKSSDFIHSSSGKEMKVIITSLSNEGYTRRFVKAVRVL
jgi:cell wall-associated NlpC family hydrolase